MISISIRTKTIKLTSAKELREIVKSTAKKASQELVQLGFKTETDPYGNRWAPKKKKNGKPILVNTGRMKKSFRYKTGLSQVKISNLKKYAIYHLTGIPGKMPPRLFVPFKKSSKLWNKFIRGRVDKALQRALK